MATFRQTAGLVGLFSLAASGLAHAQTVEPSPPAPTTSPAPRSLGWLNESRPVGKMPQVQDILSLDIFDTLRGVRLNDRHNVAVDSRQRADAMAQHAAAAVRMSMQHRIASGPIDRNGQMNSWQAVQQGDWKNAATKLYDALLAGRGCGLTEISEIAGGEDAYRAAVEKLRVAAIESIPSDAPADRRIQATAAGFVWVYHASILGDQVAATTAMNRLSRSTIDPLVWFRLLH